MLSARQAAGKPVTVVLIGGGKFASMFLAQTLTTPGLHVMGVADLVPERARANLRVAGWPEERMAARSLDDAEKSGGTWVGEDAMALATHPAGHHRRGQPDRSWQHHPRG